MTLNIENAIEIQYRKIADNINKEKANAFKDDSNKTEAKEILKCGVITEFISV